MINDLLLAVCGQVKAWLPALKTCEPHEGRFDKEELKRVSGRAPAAYAAVLALGRPLVNGSGQQDVPVTFALYVATADRPNLPRRESALNIAEALVARINGQQWGGTDTVFPADAASAKNLYSGAISGKGVALWAVTWSQVVRMGDDVWAVDYPLPTRLYLGFAPDIGEGHEDDYILIAEREAES